MSDTGDQPQQEVSADVENAGQSGSGKSDDPTSENAWEDLAAGESHPMPEWRSHKLVHAAVIERIVEEPPGYAIAVQVMGAVLPVPPDIFARGTPVIGQDYLVRYGDGYQSWSPKAAFEDGYSPSEQSRPTIAELEALINAGGKPELNPDGTLKAQLGGAEQPLPRAPHLGVLLHDLGEGMCGIHAIEPDGTEHSMTMPANHGALLAFKAAVLDWLGRLGARATAWDKTPPEAHDGQASDQA